MVHLYLLQEVLGESGSAEKRRARTRPDARFGFLEVCRQKLRGGESQNRTVRKRKRFLGSKHGLGEQLCDERLVLSFQVRKESSSRQ